jgi:hypothetical protein
LILQQQQVKEAPKSTHEKRKMNWDSTILAAFLDTQGREDAFILSDESFDIFFVMLGVGSKTPADGFPNEKISFGSPCFAVSEGKEEKANRV